MTNSQRLNTVRLFLQQWITDSKSPSVTDSGEPAKIVTESIVIREGFYCGRSFDTGTHRAVWFIEEDELKIHDAAGDVVAVFRGEQITQPEIGTVAAPDVIKLDTDIKQDSDSSDEEPMRRAA